MKNKLSHLKTPRRRLIFSVVLSLLISLPIRIPNALQHPPRLVLLIPYVFILFVVSATVILIIPRDSDFGIMLFGAFVIPLYLMFTNPHKLIRNTQ